MVLSTLRKISRIPTGGFILAIGRPIEAVDHYDVIDKDIKTVKSFKEFVDTETGWDRIKRMFQLDEYDNISPELSSIYQAGFMGLLVGIIYGGFLGSKKAYMDFMERNQATAFESHLAAKKKLQETVVLNFARTGWKLGWRLGVFALMYMGTSTVISVYRNKFSISDYVAGGVLTGAVYKWNMGPKGMGAGGLVGGVLGLVAGSITVGLLKLTGTTMDEVRYWQYKWKAQQNQAYRDGFEIGLSKSPYYHKNVMQDLHDLKIGVARVNLDELPDEPVKEEGKKEAKIEESKKEEKSDSPVKEFSEKK